MLHYVMKDQTLLLVDMLIPIMQEILIKANLPHDMCLHLLMELQATL